MTDSEYIQEYKEMKSINEICKEVGVDSSNLLRGKAKKFESEVAKKCKCEIIRLYNIIVLGDTDGNKTNTL